MIQSLEEILKKKAWKIFLIYEKFISLLPLSLKRIKNYEMKNIKNTNPQFSIWIFFLLRNISSWVWRNNKNVFLRRDHINITLNMHTDLFILCTEFEHKIRIKIKTFLQGSPLNCTTTCQRIREYCRYFCSVSDIIDFFILLCVTFVVFEIRYDIHYKLKRLF
jgi:hypothetical protein